jgi:predicted RNase H-like HicB family nuclease
LLQTKISASPPERKGRIGLPSAALYVHRAMKMQKRTLHFTAVIYPDADSDWLVARNPETGTTTRGKTFEAALANLKEATQLFLSEFPQATKGRAILTTFEVSSLAHA